MADYIDRDMLAKEINRLSTHPLNEWDTMGILLLLDSIPSADVRENVHGKWVEYPIADDYYQCSICGVLSKGKFYFCSNCGARMVDDE